MAPDLDQLRLEETQIEGVCVLIPKAYEDHRGLFVELHHRRKYAELGLPPEFCQDNCSYSHQGVIRGLHYQVGDYAQGKLAFALWGSVLDVAVDIRVGSPSFGRHVAVELSAENRRQLWIPPGFAHGMSVLTQHAVFAYKCTAPYSPDHERSILYCDPDLGIDWRVSSPIVSEKDANAPCLKEAELVFAYE